MPRRAHAVEIAEVKVVLEEELGDRARRAGIDLGFEHVDVGCDRGTVRMFLRIGRHRHFEIGEALDAGDQIGGIAVAAGMRRVRLAGAAKRIAAQRHDMAHAGLRIGADHRIDLGAGRGDASQVRRRRQHGLGEDALDGGVGALARRAAGAIGDGDEIRLERRQPADRLPQRLLHLRGFRRKEFERHADAARRAGIDEAAGTRSVHHATSRVFGAASTMRGSRASQSETAILPCGPGGKGLLAHDVEAGGFEPLRHRLRRKAEPAMGVLLAQEFEVVRREIDDQQPAARPQHPRRLADGARAVVEEVQHLMNDDDVERIARQRQVVDVALPHAAILQAGAIEPGAGERQHVERQVEAEAALDVVREQLQHAAGAGAEIEQRRGSACRRARRGSLLRRRHRRHEACGCDPIRRRGARK